MELTGAKEQLEKAVKRAYQHVAFLAQPDPDGERGLDQVTFDDEHSTSLDGTIVWKALAERDKVFDAGAFNAKALVHNLRDGDYGRTLSDLRAAFYSAPRLPLLYAGDRDLQQGIYDASQPPLCGSSMAPARRLWSLPRTKSTLPARDYVSRRPRPWNTPLRRALGRTEARA